MSLSNFTDEFLDIFASEISARMCNTEEEATIARKLGELCRKHGVSYTKVMLVLRDFGLWQQEECNHED